MGICSSSGREERDDDYIGTGAGKQLGFGKIEIVVKGLLDIENLEVAMHMNTQVLTKSNSSRLLPLGTLCQVHALKEKLSEDPNTRLPPPKFISLCCVPPSTGRIKVVRL